MHPNRETQVTAFLHSIGWAEAARTPLAGDASGRRYERLSRGPNAQSAVLMDAPGAYNEALGPFITIASFLHDQGFSAPDILFSDPKHGFLLLEDLGDTLFARLAKTDPIIETKLYNAAVDFLIDLHQRPIPTTCKAYSAPIMAGFSGLVFDYYAPQATDHGKDAALHLLTNALEGLQPFTPVVALRDFHSENLIWLPKRAGNKRVGLLDFQDAFISHPVYDLISLTKDARRDVSLSLTERVTTRYITKTGQDKDRIWTAVAVYAVLRNLRILGVFSRLAIRDGKPSYLNLIPRVWGYLLHDLTHPSLAVLQETLLTELPEPTQGYLNDLREKCPTRPTQF